MKVYNKAGVLLYDINESKEINRGGEGRIIDISPDKVAKIYLPNIVPLSEIKFNELVELKSNTFVKPEELLFDLTKKVIGFSMKKVPSNFYPLLSIFNKNFCLREGITTKIKLLINERIIDAVKFAHTKGIVIGDINPYNILVNDKGMVYFLDVDSYETPSVKHSGILLDDIRDYLYGGNVTTKSDYFAVDVLAFNGLTYTHPYKGVCKSMPKISDRMLNKKSILSNATDVIVPKCYEPITNPNLLWQFKQVFNDGDRFLVNLSGTQQPVVKAPKVVVPTIIKTNELVIHALYSGGGTIINSYASKERLVLSLDTNQMLIYDVSLKGSYNLISIKDYVDPKYKLFVHKTSVYSIIRNTLIDALDGRVLMTFNTDVLKSELYNNILVVVTNEAMYKFDLDAKNSYTIDEAFGPRFNGLYSLYQNVSGSTVLFYEKGGLNSVFLKTKIRNLHQSGNFGIIEQIDNEKVCYKMFFMKNLQIEIFDVPYTSLRMFDYLNENIIVLPEDDKLTFLNTGNMQEIISYKSNEIFDNSVIHCTNGGIVVVNNDTVYFMNKK
jgi:serine/threonine protein kinase